LSSSIPRLGQVSLQDSRWAGFTLVELLVSVLVLVLILLLCTEMLTIVVSSWNLGRAQADNFSKARVALDIIAQDVEAEVVRQDLPAFFNTTAPALTFYTKEPGLLSPTTTGTRPLSRVLYYVTNEADGSCVLRRSANGFNFGDDVGYSPATWSVQMNTPTIDADIGPGVLIMNYQFIGTSGLNIVPANVNNAWANSGTLPGIGNLRAVIISMAVIDGRSLKVLTGMGKLSQLQTNFSTSDPGPIASFASSWQAQLEGATQPLRTGGIPASVLTGLKTFERTVMLPALTKE
jgi:type II secretory pathway pseudopilin PulG